MSLKRKSTDLDPSNTENVLPEIDSDDDRLNHIDWNCDQVRRRIRTFIECKEMKIGEFQNAIGVTSRSYLDFMGQSGRDKGAGSATYINAARFFKKRELRGIKPPRKKRVTKASQKEAAEKYDVSGVHLDGEEDQQVSVWDTCDVVRRKISAHLRKPNITKAQFLRDISKAAYPGMDRTLSGNMLNEFLSKRGPNAGNTSRVFYAAYVYFEKLRIRDKKPKNKFREEMEDVWQHNNGFDCVTSPSTGIWVTKGETPYTDKYGRISIGGWSIFPIATERSGKPADFTNYVSFLKKLKDALGSDGHKYGLTITLSLPYWFNVMTYDLHGTWDSTDPYIGSVINAHTNLTEIEQTLDLLRRNNINLSKIQDIVANGATVIGDKDAAITIVTWCNNQWVSYNNDNTLKAKMDYANQKCLGGVMVWASSTDDALNTAFKP
ncbi:uncharacterized protein ACLA_007300 [Aspergillus clavatus NRRL 1]|uniref:chitinase n=1 Tax=Aspergillus clavatus (strain ATCC 1007 / CBS 513.65 / DSM 816 / NCTC 3887 / NRRL 1 / QM 1276 / 107) TaxID=344612 RepID=A1CDP4_ASPCL|nr:uncharacterized protein ACLA_007300 [Aspergillus clavatus NRRL 1]EAW11971.1 conserved hypothetical protein [Aspergillus clavatus NRRL 1]